VTREVVELSPMESWIQHLMHNVLVKRTIDKVLKYLRKLHWEDPEVSSVVVAISSKLNIRFTATCSRHSQTSGN
jgi:hypothetical protein